MCSETVERYLINNRYELELGYRSHTLSVAHCSLAGYSTTTEVNFEHYAMEIRQLGAAALGEYLVSIGGEASAVALQQEKRL